MGRRCDCSILLDELATNPALKTASLASRAVWLALLRAMQVGAVSVLRFGSHVPNRMELAMLVAASETETETEIAALVERGLLVREADGALASPLLQRIAKRSETNRINGLKGGRPRKDGSDRRQTSILLPIAGDGAGAESETEPKPNAPPGQLKLASSSLAKKKASLAKLDEATTRLLAAAGLPAERLARDRGCVAAWLQAGHDLDDIAALIARRADAGAEPQHLGYFNRAVADLATAPAPAAAMSPAEAPQVAAWRVEFAIFERKFREWGDYGCVGPMPVMPPKPVLNAA